MQQCIVVPWDETKFYGFGQGPQRRYLKWFPGLIADVVFQRIEQSNQIQFIFDDENPFQVLFAHDFCTFFYVEDLPKKNKGLPVSCTFTNAPDKDHLY